MLYYIKSLQTKQYKKKGNLFIFSIQIKKWAQICEMKDGQRTEEQINSIHP